MADRLDDPEKPDEFRLIAELFAPLSRSFPGAHGLTDDAAYIDGFGARKLAVTTDALVAGVHFHQGTRPDLIARKALRVNLSDLAAKGAQPFAALLTVAFPKDIDMVWLRAFADGLKQDLEAFGVALIGGDTVSTPGPLMISVTLMGWVGAAGAPLRSGAKPGDVIWVSGTIGDGALGLDAGRFTRLSAADRDFLIGRYEVPQPRLGFGQAASGLFHAAMDVSDGLVQDLGHMAKASGVGAEIDCALIPLSAAARAAIANHDVSLEALIAGGDDYEILAACAPEAAPALEAIARGLRVEFTAIGRIVPGQGVRVQDRDGIEMTLSRGGWRHF